MPYPLTFLDTAMSAEFMFVSQSALLGDPEVASVIDHLHVFRAKVDLDTFEFSLKNGMVYDYQFRHKDGRKWDQQLDFAFNGPENPGQSFNSHNDFWLLTEFRPNRDLRDAIIKLHNWRALESIMVTFV